MQDPQHLDASLSVTSDNYMQLMQAHLNYLFKGLSSYLLLGNTMVSLVLKLNGTAFFIVSCTCSYGDWNLIAYHDANVSCCVRSSVIHWPLNLCKSSASQYETMVSFIKIMKN